MPKKLSRSGGQLRAAREAEGWSRPELARRIRAAADDEARRRLPNVTSLVDMIKQWESDRHQVSPRYEALLKQCGIELAEPSRRTFFAAGVGLAGLAIAAPHFGPPSEGRRIGASTIERLRERTTRLRNLDDFLGGADTYRLYIAELSTTKQLAKEAVYTEAVGRDLHRIICEQAQQSGWAAFDAGWHPQARQHFAEARTAAEAASDSALAGNCLAYSAYQDSMTGGNGLVEAIAAHQTAGAAAPGQVRALLLEREAWAHAVTGDEQRTGQALSKAHDALADDRQESPHWASWVDEIELQIMTGRCWAELGRPLRAVPALETGLARYDDSHARDKALYLTWLAAAYLDGQEVEQATETVERAMQLATGVASVRPQQRIHALLGRFQPYETVPAVVDLLDRAEEWLTQPSYG